ncbi:MAG: ATP-binding protein [Desulfopila sp.]
MIISVASGKGGTGKTTVATNLAAALGEDCTFLDCDVEEPNAHLFLKPDIHSRQDVFTFLPEVDKSRCDQCGKCRDICRFGAITIVGSSLLLFDELCHSCYGCMEVCPQKCISEGKRMLGTIESGKANDVDFHHGILRVGEAMSPPLIKRIRKEYQKGKTIIIDAPPGTSCPVIAAMHQADFVVLVTEPTPFGLHDLKLAHETVKQMGLAGGVVINRANLGDNSVQEYARANDLPILLEIPFSKTVAEHYSRGTLLVDTDPSWRHMFKELFATIEKQTTAVRSEA